MIPARTRATNFVLDTLQRDNGWIFRDDARQIIFDEVEKLIERVEEEVRIDMIENPEPDDDREDGAGDVESLFDEEEDDALVWKKR